MFQCAAVLVFVMTLSFPTLAAVTEIKTLPQYTKLYKDKKPLVILYSSPTCDPCKAMKPHFVRASNTYRTINFAIIDTHTKNAALSRMVENRAIMSVPTLIGSRFGKDIFEESGWAGKDELMKQLQDFKKKTGVK